MRPSPIDFPQQLTYPRPQRGRPQRRPFSLDFELRGMSDEAHLPAEQSRAQAPARLPRPDGDRRRAQGYRGAPQPRPQEAVGVTTAQIGKLSRRADFLAANGAL